MNKSNKAVDTSLAQIAGTRERAVPDDPKNSAIKRVIAIEGIAINRKQWKAMRGLSMALPKQVLYQLWDTFSNV